MCDVENSASSQLTPPLSEVFPLHAQNSYSLVLLCFSGSDLSLLLGTGVALIRCPQWDPPKPETAAGMVGRLGLNLILVLAFPFV